MKTDKLADLSIYIHIPFCKQKCLYCDFLSAPPKGEQIERYVKALICEIPKEAVHYQNYQVQTVFIGGGTPSLLTGQQMDIILQTVLTSFQMTEQAEISMECNPGTTTPDSLYGYRSAGINRLSIGLQSADDIQLKELGRIHTWQDFLKTYEDARAAGFQNINVDLMSALPGQTLLSYQNTLHKVVELEPQHISAYSLIIEEGTPFYQRYGEDCQTENMQFPMLPEEEVERKMYRQTESILKQAGYERYEISNYAKRGFACHHNLTYWTGGAYVGFGTGAASYVEGIRYKNKTQLQEYLKLIESDGNLRELREEVQVLSCKDKMEEFMFIGLRLIKGVSCKQFYNCFGCKIEDIYGTVLERLHNERLLSFQGDRICLTKRGIDISNYVMAEFLL